ncbi:MAG: tape measure protein [Lachnospiraceae bacterium]|nr:tape measure protein [Lachnospiraceae bacterium]
MSAISTIISLQDNMSATLNRIEGRLRLLNGSMGEAAKSGSELDSALSAIRPSALASAAGVASLVGAVAGIGRAVKSSLGVAGEFENMENGLSTVLKSAERGKAMFEDLRKFSLETTFGVDTLAGVSQQLLTLGVNEDQLKDKLKMLGDIAGGSTSKFNELSDVYSKVLATGSATSMQIQQLSRIVGFSFSNALGKTSASARELDGLFRKLTADGGMFAGAMSGAIDTMEGKLGFVTDTFRELQVSFAEMSGLTEAYKGGLDLAYGALQGIVNAMQSINENPVAQAAVKGVLVAGAGALAGTLGGAMLSSLMKINAQLGITAALKTAINPTGVLVGAGIAAAIAGVALAVSAYRKHVEETKTELDELIEKREELERKESGGAILSADDRLAISYANVAEYKKLLDNVARDQSLGDTSDELARQKDEIEQALANEYSLIERLKEEDAAVKRLNRSYEGVLSIQQQMTQAVENSNKSYESALELAQSIYDKTKDGQKELLKNHLMQLQTAMYGKLEPMKDPLTGREYLKLVSPEGQDKKKLEVAAEEIRRQLEKVSNGNSLNTKSKEMIDLTKDFRELLSKSATREFDMRFSQTTPTVNIGEMHVGTPKEAGSTVGEVLSEAEERVSSEMTL